MTQTDLGVRTHLRQGTISRLENGEPKMQIQTLMDVLAVLDLEIVIRPRTKATISEIEDIF